MNTIGLDVGGTKIFAGRYSADLQLEAETKIPTEADKSVDVILQNLLKAIAAVRDESTQAIGIAWAGFVKDGHIMESPNIAPLSGFALKAFLEKETGLPCRLENDARCFAFGEFIAQSTHTHCLGLIIGTGVGGGMIVNGKIMTGTNNTAGEVGHIRINGQSIEHQIAGPGLQKIFGVQRLSDLTAADYTDKQLAPLLEAITDWLHGLLLTMDPGLVVIGGGAGIHFWKQHQSVIEELLNKKIDQKPVHFELAFSERKNAGGEGAAKLAQSL